MSSTDHSREAERLLGRAHHFTYGDGGDPATGAALAAEGQGYALLALTAAVAQLVGQPAGTEETVPAAPTTVYRASHDSISMGLYKTREAARAHCEAAERQAWAKGHIGVLGWVPDDGSPEAPEELSLFWPDNPGNDGAPDETCTGYVVTPLTVAAAYDEEAGE
ncbi:hypothetical protein [Streptomyces sp. CAU 1734]|uniref:hypothetical protein n=1 Tax=Streptomyces sp. CAU 1734 TaxID=3140360 RepID=UPI003260EAA7